MLRVFAKEPECTHLSTVEIASRRQYWNIDARKIVSGCDHVLPIRIVRGMREPPLENRIRCAVNFRKVAIRKAARVPLPHHGVPARAVVVRFDVQTLHVRGIEWP